MTTSIHRRGVVKTLICLLSVALMGLAPLAHADPLDDQKDATAKQIAAIQQQVAKNEDVLNQSNAALAAAQQQLAAAQSDLAAKQQAVNDAKAADDAMAAQLAIAQQELLDRQAELVDAQAAVQQGLADIAAKRDEIGLIAQTAAQQNTTLLSIAMLFNGADFNHMNQQAQWANTVFTANEAAMEALKEAQVQLEILEAAAQAAEIAAAEAEATVRALKEATAAQLVKTQQAKDAAAKAAAAVQAQVSGIQTARAAADAALKQSQAQLAQLNNQLVQINNQIQAQLAAAAAAAAAGNPPASVPDATTPTTPGDAGLAIAVFAQLVETWGGGTYLWGGGHSTFADMQLRLAHQFKGGSSYICYESCPRTPNGYGVDCSGFVRSVIYGATGHDIGQFLASYRSANATGMFTRVSSMSQAKPGDIFIHDGYHTGVIIYNDTANGRLSTVEARSTYLGIGPSTQYYSSGYGIFRYIGPVKG